MHDLLNCKHKKVPARHTAHYAMEGFTLVEISIVLVVIGLLVGGILAGRDLIRAAELRSVVSDLEKYTAAVNSFRLKYNALPGDMRDAESIWGTDPGGCPDPSTGLPDPPYTATPHTATCNGDGNGHIGDLPVLPVKPCEWFRAWQQLADAGLIAGAYSGVHGPASSTDAVIGVNVPASQLPGAGYTLTWYIQESDTVDDWAPYNRPFRK